MKVDITGYWFFSCDPAFWEIDLFLKTNRKYGTYKVAKNHEDKIKPGQLGVIRVSRDTRTKKQLQGRKKLISGIYAIVQILDFPIMRVSDDAEFNVNKQDTEKEELRVKIRYLNNLIDSPLLINALKENEIVNQDKYLINGFQSATWPLRKDAFDEIINMLGTDDQIFENIEFEKVDTNEEIEKQESKYQNASPQVKEIISRRIERGKISSEVKKLNKYKCKVCEALGQNPYSFKKINGDYYIETHHIDPVANLAPGSLGISNLITVCANHHRQFHYGDIMRDNGDGHLTIEIEGKILLIEKNTIENLLSTYTNN